MASQDQAVTSTPIALAGLVVSKKYFLQNGGGTNNRDLRVAIKASVDDVDRAGGFTLKYGEGQPVSIVTGESVFIWHDLPSDDDDFTCAYDEEA